MSGEFWAVISVGVALAALMLRMGSRLDRLTERVAALGERVAGIEGYLRGAGSGPNREAASD